MKSKVKIVDNKKIKRGQNDETWVFYVRSEIAKRKKNKHEPHTLLLLGTPEHAVHRIAICAFKRLWKALRISRIVYYTSGHRVFSV